MKSLEEQLWDFIDGSATPEEHAIIENKLLTDPAAKMLYEQLLEVNSYLTKIDLDEPSMSFSRNVMDKVALEIAPVALKTKTNNKIMAIVGGFFIVSLLALFIYAVSQSDGTVNVNMPAFNFSINTSSFLSPLMLKVFLFLDLAIALVYFDSVLRRKLNAQKKDQLAG